MAKTDSASLIFDVRRDSKQRALHQALLVPWQQLAASAAAFAERHIMILWVRVISENTDQLPEIVRCVLRRLNPGFLENRSREKEHSIPIWKSLEDWVIDHCFSEARAEGWFDAVMYYAYKDLRIEQTWTTWERTKADWGKIPPPEWPTLEQWTAEVLATRSLAHPETEKARAVQALGKVESARFSDAVTDLLEMRALALWADSVSAPRQLLDEAVTTELCSRCRGLLPGSGGGTVWGRPLFSRILRLGESSWRKTARAEGWYAVLRYTVFHHPRYQRLIHYHQRCHDQRSRIRLNSSPSFTEWLAAADAYCAGRKD